jgi:hypothetical protein
LQFVASFGTRGINGHCTSDDRCSVSQFHEPGR